MRKRSISWKKIFVFSGAFIMIIILSVVALFKVGFFDSPTEKHLRQALAGSATTVKLPPHISGQDWKEALIICPYTNPATLPQKYQVALKNKELYSESFNWVLYELADGTVINHEVGRANADFCGDRADILVTPKCEFTVEKLGENRGPLLKPKC